MRRAASLLPGENAGARETRNRAERSGCVRLFQFAGGINCGHIERFKLRSLVLQEEFHSEVDFHQRLKQAVDEDLRSKSAIAGLVGVHPTVLSRWLKNVQPDADNVRKLAKVLNLNVQWLLNGEGKMRPEWRSDTVIREETNPASNARLIGPIDEVFIGSVPVISWAHAGAAACYEELPPHWQNRIPTMCKGKRAFGLVIEGDSMTPQCMPGDIVTVDPDVELRNGCLVVAKLKDDGVILRRFTRLDSQRLKLIAYNTLYPSTEHMMSDFHWIYPVHSTFRRELM